MNLDRTIKVSVAVFLIVCLFDMPYGYYEFVRLVSFVSFSFLAYGNYQKKRENLAFLFIALALLFQPFIKIVLGREIWNVIDILVAALLIGSVLKEIRK